MTDTLREHVLKCHPQHFSMLKSGVKTFEVRRDDRGFCVGDVLVLIEWPQPDVASHHFHTVAYRMPTLRRRITYILPGGQYGIEPEFVVLGLAVAR